MRVPSINQASHAALAARVPLCPAFAADPTPSTVDPKPGFRDELATFEPRQHVPDLEEIGFARRVASLKVICALR